LARTVAGAVGVDFSPAAIAAARSAYAGRAEFVEADLRSLPFDAGEFDGVVCFETLTHVDEPERVLDELRRVLKPDGVMLVSAPNREVYPAGNPLHLSSLSSSELETLLSVRFAKVAVHRQQSYFASLLGDEETLAKHDPADTIDAYVTKLSGGMLESELHAVAAATDGELPAPPSWLAIGNEVDYAEQQRELVEWRERAVQAEAEALALRRELDAGQS
jgi:SAM-dependent methyltransferase